MIFDSSYASNKKCFFFKRQAVVRNKQFNRKSIFPVTKCFGLFFCNIECDKPKGTNCEGPKRFLTITVEVKYQLFRT